MRNVWDKNFGYTFFKPYIEWAFRTCYTKITIKGRENIPDPETTSVILTGNHTNTLMDALMLLQARKAPTVFVARADIFSNPLIARILTNLRILPIYRKRDCTNSMERNVAIFDNVVESLNHGLAFGIFPEGTHRPRRSLLPIKKGAFRIAQQAKNTNPTRPVCLVPFGIEYDDYFHIMHPVSITFGTPIEIKGDEDLDQLSSLLHDRIANLITWFPDDENLDDNERAFEESKRRPTAWWHWPLAILLLPFFILAVFLCSPMLLATLFLKPRMKDKAWLNTMRFACKQTLTPFTVAGAAIAGFTHWPWWLALILTVATLYAHPVFYWILEFYRSLRQ